MFTFTNVLLIVIVVLLASLVIMGILMFVAKATDPHTKGKNYKPWERI